jgi:hypothetical protein
MFINDTTLLVRQEQHKDLVRAAEQDRLTRTAGLRSSSAGRIALPRLGSFNFGAVLKSLRLLTYQVERR